MRSTSDAGDGRLLTNIRLGEVTRPEDPRLGDLSRLLERTFADPNSVLGLDRIQQFLSESATDGPRRFHVTVAEHRGPPEVVGLSIFSYVVRSNCGFSEYLVVDQFLRQRGLARALFDQRKAILDADAVRHGHAACSGLFIEVDNPWRTPADLLARESFDPVERLRVFAHFGFRRVALAYTQPPLAPDKDAVDHMDLLFVPWARASQTDAIPSEWILRTLEPIWSAWTPESAGTYLERLRRELTTPTVALIDPLNTT
ncbi:MAG TPA: hypothetical protein VGJ60_11430 [Chloroflexota bacterium]|jgi:GNAT superfamily N-acetyltransferase